MLSIVNERQITEEQAFELELEGLAPEKFDPEITFKVNKEYSDIRSEVRYRPLTREETAALLAKGKVTVQTEELAPAVYGTLPREVVERLVREHFEYKHKSVSKKEDEEWVSQKTIELETKTKPKTKHSNSTKASKP
jgi:hypothetical protein